MDGRAFLDVAQEVVAGTTEAHWRTTIVKAYYALLLECREALGRWGFPVPPHQSVHSWVRLRFIYASDKELKQIGHRLDLLVSLRNKASYDLSAVAAFANDREAVDAIVKVRSALSVLDAIDADPARRAAAIASLPP